MVRYKIIYDMNSCIGAGECENLSNLWKINAQSKAVLSGAVQTKPGIFELEISESDFQSQKTVVANCPSECIKLLQF